MENEELERRVALIQRALKECAPGLAGDLHIEEFPSSPPDLPRPKGRVPTGISVVPTG